MRTFLSLTTLFAFVVMISCETMTDSYRKAILDAHNYQRTNVSPQPSDMNKLEWSMVLETMATYTSAVCEEQRDDGGKEECGGFGAVGYNQGFAKYISRPDVSTFEDLVKGWYDLGGYYNYDYNLCYADEENICSPYLQAVFNNVTAVGCASNMCYMDVKDDGQYIGTVLVCYYTPGWIMNPEEDDNNNDNNNGNDNGGLASPKPYTSGNSCQKCLESSPYCSNGLCSPYKDDYNLNGAGSSTASLYLFTLAGLLMSILSFL